MSPRFPVEGLRLSSAGQDGHSPELLSKKPVLSTGGKTCMPMVCYTNTMPTTQFMGPNHADSKENHQRCSLVNPGSFT